MLPVERKRPVFEGRPVQFRAWEWWSCTKTDTESRSTLWAINELEVRREKEASDAEVRLAEFFDNRADTIWSVLVRDHLVRIDILPNVNSVKMNQDAKQGTSVCSRTARLKNNQVKSRRRAFKTEKATTRVLLLLRKLYLNWDVSRKTPSRQNFRKEWSVGETRGEKFWDQFDGYDSHSPRNVKQVSEKIKDHRLQKYKSNFLISEVLTLWNLRTDLKKRLKDKSDAPARDFNSAELETMRISKNPTTVITANGEVQTREETTENVKELDLFVTVMLLEETPAVLSHGKLWEDNGCTYHWTSGQKPHLTPKWQKNELQYGEPRNIRCPWSVDEFLYFIFTCFFNIFWRIILESLYVHTTQIRNKWDCSAQSKGRHLCGIVAIRSGWKLVGGFHGILLVSAKCSGSLVWWEDTYERRFGKPFNGPVIPFGATVEYHPISAKDLSRLHQFGLEILPGIFLGYVLYAGGIWKGDIMVADIEELEQMDASQLHARRLNAKEVLTPMKGENFIFQS